MDQEILRRVDTSLKIPIALRVSKGDDFKYAQYEQRDVVRRQDSHGPTLGESAKVQRNVAQLISGRQGVKKTEAAEYQKQIDAQPAYIRNDAECVDRVEPHPSWNHVCREGVVKEHPGTSGPTQCIDIIETPLRGDKGAFLERGRNIHKLDF